MHPCFLCPCPRLACNSGSFFGVLSLDALNSHVPDTCASPSHAQACWACLLCFLSINRKRDPPSGVCVCDVSKLGKHVLLMIGPVCTGACVFV
eukprot:scaffold96748_cov19-Tisochrysis_lutea.AAC.1